MASSKQSVGLQITIAIFGLLFVISTAIAYMQYRELADNQSRFNDANDQKNTADGQVRELIADIDELKARMGTSFPEVGRGAEGPNTALGAAQEILIKARDSYGLPTLNLAAAIEHLEQRIDQLDQDLQTRQGELQTANATIAQLRGQYQGMVDTERQARVAAEADREQVVKSAKESDDRKQKLIDALNDKYNNLRVEHDDAVAAFETERKKLVSDSDQLVKRVDDLREKLKTITRVSFERPDGVVRWVNNSLGLVWLNLGAQDGLKVRTTFSVYTKGHHGVARGAEDIKGQIEVTRIVDAHTAEARILDDDIFDPIAKDDPIYTPLWSPGRREKFAIVGRVDLDQDGILDRDQFRDLVADSGATLNTEVTDDGVRIRYLEFPNKWVEWTDGEAELDSDTKYLIKADIPDPALALQDDEKEKRVAIGANLDKLREETRRLGIEEINLSDFLSYIGYKPQRRIYVPGVADRPYNLRSGAASASVDEIAGDRSSGGNVSAKFGRSSKLKPQTSSGQTSKRFGTGYAN
jgi:hypothetical protein